MLSNFINMNQALTYIYLNMVVYCVPLVFLYLYLGDHNTSLLLLAKNSKKLFLLKIILLLFFANLAGLPPLPGFFVKLNLFLILLNYTNLIVGVLFVVLNFIIFFFYISAYKKITYLKNKVSFLPNMRRMRVMLLLLLYIVCFPLIYPYLAIWSYTVFI